jgi:hypothetical protein
MNQDLLARLLSHAPSPDTAVEVGQAFLIQIEPDLTAGERINVGVGVVSRDGERKVKMLSDFGRLECLYGRETVELIEVLVDFARAAALSGARLDSPNVHFSAAQPFFDVPADQYLDQVFARAVPAAVPRRDQVETETPRDTDALWREVGNVIKLRIPERAEQIIASVPYTTVQTARGLRQVTVPLQPRGGVGALESADFSAGVTERKLMRALLDVEAAAEALDLNRVGLFIARPRRVRREQDLRAIDKAIDYAASRAPRQCRVEVEADAAALADHIIDWADLHERAAA